MRGYMCARLRSPPSMPPTPGMSLCVSCVSGVVGGGLSGFFCESGHVWAVCFCGLVVACVGLKYLLWSFNGEVCGWFGSLSARMG